MEGGCSRMIEMIQSNRKKIRFQSWVTVKLVHLIQCWHRVFRREMNKWIPMLDFIWNIFLTPFFCMNGFQGSISLYEFRIPLRFITHVWQQEDHAGRSLLLHLKEVMTSDDLRPGEMLEGEAIARCTSVYVKWTWWSEVTHTKAARFYPRDDGERRLQYLIGDVHAWQTGYAIKGWAWLHGFNEAGLSLLN